MRDLWCTKWLWARFSSEYFSSALSVVFYQRSILTHSTTTDATKTLELKGSLTDTLKRAFHKYLSTNIFSHVRKEQKSYCISQETVFNHAEYCPLECDPMYRGSSSFVVNWGQKNSTENKSHLSGKFLPERTNIS